MDVEYERAGRPEVEQHYNFSSYTTVMTLEKDGKRYSFGMDNKIFIRFGEIIVPAVKGVFMPAPGTDVYVAEWYPDDSYVITCEDPIAFRDPIGIARKSVKDVLKRIGIPSTDFEAGVVYDCLRVWPPEASTGWTHENYLNQMVSAIKGYIEPYHGSWNGAADNSKKRSNMVEIFFGAEAAELIGNLLDNNPYLYNLMVEVRGAGRRRFIELLINDLPINQFMEQYGVSGKELVFASSLSTLDTAAEIDEENKWWQINPYEAYLAEKQSLAAFAKEQGLSSLLGASDNMN